MKAPATSPDEPEPDRYVAQALQAFAAATTVDELTVARLEHAGDRSPLSLAARAIGELPPEARAEMARRITIARARINQGLTVRTRELTRVLRQPGANTTSSAGGTIVEYR